ncbi:MAG: ATP-binding protein [Acidobacteriota bacterium]|nr:ATP-binding protein [Acidobacteriota bacterium]
MPCSCTEIGREARARERARIPARYENRDFENFDVDPYDHQEPDAASWSKSLKEARLVVESFAREYPAGSDHGLLLMGPCGVGKTHLAVAALKVLAARGHEGVFYDYRDLLKQIQASYNPESQTTEMEVLEPVLKAEVLLLDDLGSSKPSAWALETVGHILNARYNDNRVTIITTNYLDAPRSGDSGRQMVREDILADRIGQRIRSRLYEICRTVIIHAADYRERVMKAWR